MIISNKSHTGSLFALAASACLFLFSCKANIDLPTPTAGTSADFTKYVAIGNSLTAGYADGGLYLEGQQNSYPSIIAKQLQQVQGGLFIQPLFASTQANGSGYLKLTGFDKSGLPVLGKVTSSLAYTGGALLDGKTPQLARYTDQPNINNFGVPGIKVLQITAPQLAGANPFFERILSPSEVGTVSYAQKVLASKPTFFTCWLGNNDALLYAVAGGADPSNPLTPVPFFNGLYTPFIGQLVAGGAKGVLATIPDVTLTPYFTTKTVAAIVAAGHVVSPQINAVFITTGAGTVRAATNSDLIVLSVDSIGVPDKNMQPRGYSPYNPLRNKDVLDSAEVNATRTAIAAYNNIIVSTAANNKLGLLDINKVLAQVATGQYPLAGTNVSLGFISGGVFSLDGIHLTPRGYAIIANEYIKVINSTYGSTVPTVNPVQYRTVKFP